MGAAAFLREKARRVEDALDACLEACDDAPPGLVEAMRYSLMAGGKRLRPALALGACELLYGEDKPAMPAACALEMIHTYSLIHDDLPAMDNDDLRRGNPTAHKQFDEATAILAGDALLTLAFQTLAAAGDSVMVCELAAAAGAAGMVGGQFLDMRAEGQVATVTALEAIHARKTGALITVSVRLGALFGGASEEALRELTRYGRQLGLLFQITDDILDVVGDSAALGKSVGKDLRSDKATYPAVVGLDAARDMARTAAVAAHDALSTFGERAIFLRELPQLILERDR